MRKSVLIVDDNRDDLYFLKRLLEGEDWDVRTAENGEIALETAHAQPPDFIISDIQMPVMDGYTLCRQCKLDEKLKHIPFVFYTAVYTESRDEKFALDLGAHSIIYKPREPEDLIHVLNSIREETKTVETAVAKSLGEEMEFFRQYNGILFSKLEKKMADLEAANEKLRLSEEKYRLSFENISDVIFLMDTDLKIISISPSVEKVLGYKPDDFIDRPVSDLRHLFTNESFRQKDIDLSMILKGKKIPIRIYEFVARDETIKVGELSAAPIIRDDTIIGLFSIARDITDRRRAEEELHNALNTIKQLKDRLEQENIYLRDEIKSKAGHGDIIGESDPMKYIMHRIRQVACTTVTVMITGETGTGKDVFAHFIHQESDRKDKPFVHVNCAGLPANLIESELFGREKGAFTGSSARQIGRFELAKGGTIFLNEVGELPIELQAKLLRVIETGEFERLGSPHTVKVDVRVIASTNRNLEDEIKKGRFRMDLFYRLNIFPLTLPSLRQRKEDIPLLAEFFKDRFSRRFGKKFEKISEDTMKDLEAYDWPGNVRELINVIERAVIVSKGPVLRLADKLSAPAIVSSPREKVLEGKNIPHPNSLLELERDHILRILERTGWRIEGQQGAARILDLNPSTLRTRMRKLDIRRPSTQDEAVP
ncbi:MAG: sigma 54-interacting transcriptional regulator [Deltaproteobacteria bacterium]|nr:sigma 54-interacting transcriptional regulator [Deltaproteobacteria bacterium]